MKPAKTQAVVTCSYAVCSDLLLFSSRLGIVAEALFDAEVNSHAGAKAHAQQ
jgi:hypothetical protein